jgi:fumarate hydratase class II
VPADKYYGSQTVRSIKNFPIGVETERMPVSLHSIPGNFFVICKTIVEINIKSLLLRNQKHGPTLVPSHLSHHKMRSVACLNILSWQTIFTLVSNEFRNVTRPVSMETNIPCIGRKVENCTVVIR